MNKPYTRVVSLRNPQLVLFLINTSANMRERMPTGLTKIEMAVDVFNVIIKILMRRAMRGYEIAPRYVTALVSYNNVVDDHFGRVVTLDQMLKAGLPSFTALGEANAAAGFDYVLELLTNKIDELASCPAPVVFHLSDGSCKGDYPITTLEQIKLVKNDDGNVCLTHIYCGHDYDRDRHPIFREPSYDWLWQSASLMGDERYTTLISSSYPLPVPIAPGLRFCFDSLPLNTDTQGYYELPIARPEDSKIV